MIRDFQGKAAFVTGSASGIGLAIARVLAAANMRVMLADIEENALYAALEDLKASGADVRAVVCDVSDRASVQRAAEHTFAAFGKVHLLCNNAGVGVGGQFEAIAPNDWEWVIGVNLMGVVYGIQAFLPHIKAHGEDAHIVNTASLAGIVCPPGTAPYNASKFGAVALSETLAAELAGTPIGVSVLCTSFVRTQIATSSRNRPARFGGPANQANEQLEALVQGGFEPETVARRVIAAVRDDDLHIFTHADPAYRAAVEERFGKILAAFDKAVNAQ
ncbi:SDR family NAD(P)-dependent oxidoreductase [Bradyrhizobium barranii subsp. apii]|uniref:SDR family NAD(P)-dependent oxidoreductase n=1 Tax=Bradyrhizobium barranii TaxID=2992140 RepID=UPI001AA1CE42|nr:SDR family NAD(P)-dependent oxidoreductase [Bradyrhizobium barranii]UPT96080.1 SDR family NAD(P)-dependent oxidoreductase [Bradyrhizobium barranii subsp. apii]